MRGSRDVMKRAGRPCSQRTARRTSSRVLFIFRRPCFLSACPGTSSGQVLVYGVRNNPPAFVQGLTVHPVYPVEALCMDKM